MRNHPQRALRDVGVDREIPVVDVPGGRAPLPRRVPDRLAHRGLRQLCRREIVKRLRDLLQDRAALLLAQRPAPPGIHRLRVTLHGVQPPDLRQQLRRRLQGRR